MFLDYYRLQEQPFGVTADPRFLYLTRNHREALASLFFTIENALGFSALIAEPGMGKTTLLFRLLENPQATTTTTAFLFETQCSSAGLVRQLLRELNVQTEEKSSTRLHDKLEEVLVKIAQAGRRLMVIIDEAQNLGPEVLETVRLLSNFEMRRTKLLHIVLSGQPEFASRLEQPDTTQLRQRISVTSWLKPLTTEETAQYIDHRLRVAGYSGGPLMSYEAVESIAVHSGGIPRNVNRICFNVLALGCALGKTHISKSLVEDAGSDVGLRLLAMQDLPNGAIYPRWSKAPDSAQQPTPDTQRAHRPSGGPPFVTPCGEIHAQAPAQPELAQPVLALPIAESASQGLHRVSARSVLRAGQWVFGWIRKTSTVRRTFLLLALEITACTALLPGQATKTSVRIASDESVTPQFQPRTPRYQIRPADIIEISFYPSAELNQTLSVQPDGYIALREAGDLYVAGKTVPELKEAVISAYRKILHEPVITIVLKEFEKPHFTVGGQVGRPGKYELRADTTASEGIAIAGGLTERAKHSQVLLFRRISKEWVEAKELDLKAVYSGKWREDIQLRPGDMLFVPQNKISKLKQFLPAWTVGTYLPPAAF